MVSTPILLTLQKKVQLTHDVYELMYATENVIHILPGQFLLCDTSGDPKLKRSYSVSWAEGNHIFFIIKRLQEGTGGSVAICDQEIGHTMQVWGPLGKFVLQDTLFPKVFIGTGTGFAPLYFQLRRCIELNVKSGMLSVEAPCFFLFGVRELRDVFYVDQLQNWSHTASFDYEIYCSRETLQLPEKYHLGRITEFIAPFLKGRSDKFTPSNEKGNISGGKRDSEENKGDFIINKSSILRQAQDTSFKKEVNSETEFYICGSPAMVTEVRGILHDQGISQEKVFFEQY